MKSLVWGGVLVVVVAACIKPNPRSCIDGVCSDQSLPFCDVDGTFGGEPNECIAVSCTPMELAACRGNDELRCNATGNNYHVTQCANGCAEGAGCVIPPSRVLYIGFASDRDGNWEIYRMHPDGTMQTNLTAHPSQDDNPVWSPDGEKIAFISDRNGSLEIYVMSADGLNVVNVSKGPANDPVWAPDSTKLIFGSARSGVAELYRVSVDGASTPAMLTMSGGGGADWSPDGTRIAFSSSGRIHVANADGSSPMPISAGSDSTPKWRPDGMRLVFSHRITFGTNHDLFVCSPDGMGAINITNSASSLDVDPVWSPDGSHIAMTGGTDPDSEIVVADPAGTTTRNLSLSPSSRDYEPCWSGDSLSVMYSSDRGGNFDLYRVNRGGGGSTNLTNSASNDRTCSVRPR